MKQFILFSLILFGSMLASTQTYNITFSVDMNNVSAAYSTVNINGTFNSWCGGCAPMTDSNSDGIWEIMIPLATGTYEYKFTYDGWTGQEILIPGSPCTLTTGEFTNRVYSVTADEVLPTVCWEACTSCAAAPAYKDITFRVDMSNVTASYTTVNLNGTFNGWCGGCIPLNDSDNDGVWETTVALQQGFYEYKFTYDGWTGQESLTPGSSCTITTGGFTNRTLTVNEDEVLPAVCWESCNICSPPLYNVTFSVDMNNVTESFTTPEVNGTFNSWCGACAPMSDIDSDNVWELTIPLPAGTYEYKYAYDNWANGGETLTPGSICTVTNFGFTNRALTVTGDEVLPVVCYESCSACSAPSYNITFQVDMNNVTESFTTPEVNGTFNGWCGACAPMTDANSDGIWELTIPLQAGTYEYKYAYDNWANGGETLAEGSSCTVTNYGFTNRALSVTADEVLPVVCYGTCSACVPPVYNITFQVDMSNVSQSFTTPEVNGNFNGWCGGCAPMTDANSDNIWELTIPLLAGSYEYKFAYDNWANGGETLLEGSPCTVTNFGFTNRALDVSGDSVLPVVCYGSCLACTNEPSTYDVTFSVDMNNVTETFTTPEVNGNFNGWCGGCAPMSDSNSDGVWEITISLPAGNYEYKFAYDAWTGQETLTEGSPCTVTNFGFTNRALSVTSDVILPTVCYGSCVSCDAQPSSYDITFQVDMNEVAEPFGTPEVNGNFNGWCGGCAPMSDSNSDGIWEITITLEEGTYEYKFAYDSWGGQETLTEGSPCTVTNFGFTNRSLSVTSDITLPPVCWGSCDVCDVPCPGDFTGDGAINVSDLLFFVSYFGCTGDCPVDMNNDGAVTIVDLLLFVSLFGTPCP